MIDSHSHLYCEAFDDDRDDVMARARAAGLRHIVLPAEGPASVERLHAMQQRWPGFVSVAMGLHPEEVRDDWRDALATLRPLFERHHYVAVGEIGTDLYWDRTYEEQQREVLKRQMLWAEELDLPVCLHIRKAHNEVFGLLRDLNRPRWRGVMHCFGGSVQEARRAVEMGFHLGIGGVVTFKNATLADVVQAVPLESLLLETDAPYLSPVPHRGQRNEPAYIPLIAQRIADLRGITIDQVAETTTASARTLFRL